MIQTNSDKHSNQGVKHDKKIIQTKVLFNQGGRDGAEEREHNRDEKSGGTGQGHSSYYHS